jgi:hypothetical protein
MENKTINISQTLIQSFIIGYIVIIIGIILIHFSNQKRNVDFPSSSVSYGGMVSGASLVSSGIFICPLGENHNFTCAGLSYIEAGKVSIPFGEILVASFSHTLVLILGGLFLSIVIYLMQRVDIKIQKE